MGDYEYLRQKADRCYQIAQTCLDLEAAREINTLGNELRRKAAERQSGPGALLDRKADTTEVE